MTIAADSVRQAEQAMADALNDPRSTWTGPRYSARWSDSEGRHYEDDLTDIQAADIAYWSADGLTLHEVREEVRSIQLGGLSKVLGSVVITRRK